MRSIFAAVICMFLLFIASTCQEIPWHEITIESRHAGLEMSQDLNLVIKSKNGVVVAGRVPHPFGFAF
jgi:hypothetical protein